MKLLQGSTTSLHLNLEVVNLGTELLKYHALSLHLIVEVLSRLNEFLLEFGLLLDDDSGTLLPHVEEIVPKHLELSLDSLIVFAHLAYFLLE